VPVMYSLLRRKAPAEPLDDDGTHQPTPTHSTLVAGEELP